MATRVSLAWFFTAAVLLSPASAQAFCDVTYKVQPGDTLFSIAEFHYEDRQKWTLLYYANQDSLRDDEVVAGSDVYIPCAPETTEPDPTPLRQNEAELTLLTGSNYAPFADRAWPGQGMVTELVNASLELAPSPVTYTVAWHDDWGQHLFPMLDEKQFDMGFPWIKPDCKFDPDNQRCERFHFSQPLMELPIMLFVRAGTGLSYDTDEDVLGRTLCRPAGYFTHDLDRADRRWLANGSVALWQPDTPEACFEALMAGDVDAVTLNVFQGANKVVNMGLRGQVVPLEKPLSRETLHVVISKTHARGTTHLYRVNAGLQALRESGRYNEIVERHLEIFWKSLK